ncbi:MAG TPA: hypothetical protein VLF90_02400 [Patescibacteria group bacterium]|nr:hypothetical protein [Patescibacteria group bacterium]
MSKQVIAVDIDDVLSDSATGFIEFSNKRWGTKLHVDDYIEDWATMWKVSHKESQKRAQDMYGPEVVANFKNDESALQVLLTLKKNYSLVITTSRSRYVQKDTSDWLARHYKGVFDAIHHAGFYDTYTPESTKQTKAELLKSVGADFIIDDHPKHCFAAAEAGIEAILFGDYKWSRDIKKLPPRVTRAQNWQEVLEYFNAKSR